MVSWASQVQPSTPPPYWPPQVQPFIRPLRDWIRNQRVQMGLLPAPRGGAKGSGKQQQQGRGASRGGAAAAGVDQPQPDVALGPVTMANFRFDRDAIMRHLLPVVA